LCTGNRGEMNTMSKTVLAVDDSKMTLDLLRFMLTSAGFGVLTASNGLEALECMDRNRVDLAIIDINMAVMDGYTLIRKIRGDDRFDEISILIATTETEAEERQKGFDAGADAYMIKPGDPDELIAQVRLLIG